MGSPTSTDAWNKIAYFQSGDNPGRKEPGTGAINHANVFSHIAKKLGDSGRDLIIGMEQGNSKSGKKGELALIQTCRKVEPG